MSTRDRLVEKLSAAVRAAARGKARTARHVRSGWGIAVPARRDPTGGAA